MQNQGNCKINYNIRANVQLVTNMELEITAVFPGSLFNFRYSSSIKISCILKNRVLRKVNHRLI